MELNLPGLEALDRGTGAMPNITVSVSFLLN